MSFIQFAQRLLLALQPAEAPAEPAQTPARLPEQTPLAPTGQPRKIRLDETLEKLSAQEQTLLQYLKPNVSDAFVLAPARYQSVLDDARQTLAEQAESAEGDQQAALHAAAALIESEQQLMAFLSAQRNLLVGA